MHPDRLAHMLGGKKGCSTFIFDDFREASKMKVAYPKSSIGEIDGKWFVTVTHTDPMEQLALNMAAEPEYGVLSFNFPSPAIASLFVLKLDPDLYHVGRNGEAVSFRRVK